MELTVANDGRVFYVERITGEVNVYNPVNGQVTTAITIPVDSVQENGLMGIQLAPDFDTSNQLYVTYTPPTPNNQTRVSRFTVGANNIISAASEQIIFTWEAQREQCCHSGGSLAFAPNGDLYISTGDNTNPFASDGFTPIDERPGRAFWDAQRTSANSNNHNGKILRIHPLPGATGAPGIGTTYSIPAGNMFDESAPTGNQTLPEIYAMGFRNPFRITVDPKTGWVLVGDYGPDAGVTVASRGPQGSVEFEVVKQPGFYGWPYCVRDNVPYNDYNFATGTSGRAVLLLRAGQQLAEQHGHHQPAAGDPGDDVDGLHRDRPAASRASAPAVRRPAVRATTSTRTSTARASSRSTTTGTGSSASGTTAGSRPPRSTPRATARASSRRRGRTPSRGRTRSSSAPTARCTSSTGAPASRATTSTPASTGSTTSPVSGGRSRSRPPTRTTARRR